MAPDSHTVKHAAGVSARVLSAAGGPYAMYFDGHGPFSVVLNLSAGDYAGEWTDIVTGDTVPLARFHHAGGAKTITTPAFSYGIALRLTTVGTQPRP